MGTEARTFRINVQLFPLWFIHYIVTRPVLCSSLIPFGSAEHGRIRVQRNVIMYCPAARFGGNEGMGTGALACCWVLICIFT